MMVSKNAPNADTATERSILGSLLTGPSTLPFRPSIVETISRYVPLRKIGKECTGLCPFHGDKHPSLFVSEEKGLFHCFSCCIGGDVIRFIELFEKTDFRGALQILGIDGGNYKGKPIPDTRKRRAATLLAAWMNQQHLKVGVLCRELSRKIGLAESTSDLHEDLQNPQSAAELWRAREAIEGITERAEPERLPAFPELTPEYREYMRAAVRGELC